MPPRWRIVRALATLAAAAVLMLVVAEWLWRWLAPAPSLPVARKVDVAPASTIAGAPWFGAHADGAPAVNASAASSPTRSQADPRLLGVIVGGDGRGYALLRTPDRGPLLVASGQEIAPGVTLEAITNAGIRVAERGETREIALRPATPPPSSPSTASSAPAPKAAVAAACVPPGGANAPVYRLNAELLTGMVAKPESWSSAFVATPDGLALRDGNAFGSMLGMTSSDRVLQANGVALRSSEDVLVAFLRPLVANQAVRVSGIRGGKPTDWIFVNATGCP